MDEFPPSYHTADVFTNGRGYTSPMQIHFFYYTDEIENAASVSLHTHNKDTQMIAIRNYRLVLESRLKLIISIAAAVEE